jgi:hypothetical protein
MRILKQVLSTDARADLTLTPRLNHYRIDESLRQFFDAERALIVQRRQAELPRPRGSGEELSERHQLRETDARTGHDPNGGDYVGLALSGGGIRSATFCLGVLQVFEEKGVMPHVDYLSTVSGGGYLGGAYSAWRYRQALHAAGPAAVDPDNRGCPVAVNPPPASLDGLVLHLRKFGRYLSPRLGVMDSEPWRIVGTFVRNLVIHWLVLVATILALFAALLLSLRHLYLTTAVLALGGLACAALGAGQEWAAGRCMRNPQRRPDDPCPKAQRLMQSPHLLLFAGLAMCGLTAALGFVASTRVGFPELASFSEFFTGATGVQQLGLAVDAVLPLLPFLRELLPAGVAPVFAPGLSAAVVLFAVAALVVTACGFVSDWRWTPRRVFVPNAHWLGLALGFAIYLGLWLALAASQGAVFQTWASVPLDLATLLSFTTVYDLNSAWAWVWQTALVVFVFGAILSLYIAVFNWEMDREEREWATRLVSIALMTASGWLLVAGLVILSAWLAVSVHTALAEGYSFSASVAAALTAAGAWIGVSSWAARLASSQAVKALSEKYWKQLLLQFGPPLFLIGLVLLCGFAAATLVIGLGQGPSALWTGKEVGWLLWAALAVLVIGGVVLDPNEFSLHGFYRDRIVRCYLGASNADSPAPDSVWNVRTDDVPLRCLAESVRAGAPFPIVNTAVNLFGSKDLQVQQRNCDSFVLTPSGCGSWATNYAPMPPGLYLGSAIAASGAAVSSGMGMATRGAALAALMTVFNLRLGFWFGNPRKEAQRHKRPAFAPSLLLLEGFSMTNENRRFVNLSDGGHFDNLGLYELIRRRCKHIIVLDAECDENYGFEALEQVIRFARVDFNVHIDLDFHGIAPAGPTDRYARAHWAVGSIDYSRATVGQGRDRGLSPYGEDDSGCLLYIKSSLTDPKLNPRVSRDVLGYALRHPRFPHEPTTDQFFSEAQFESYRELGRCIGTKLLKDWSGRDLKDLFDLAAAPPAG